MKNHKKHIQQAEKAIGKALKTLDEAKGAIKKTGVTGLHSIMFEDMIDDAKHRARVAKAGLSLRFWQGKEEVEKSVKAAPKKIRKASKEIGKRTLKKATTQVRKIKKGR